MNKMLSKNKMSKTCNLGYHRSDAAFQNLTVNNKLTVKNSLKSVKAEIGRLNSLVDNSLSQQFVGSYTSTSTSNPLASTHILPSGPTNESDVNDVVSVRKSFYTDAALRVDNFHVTVVSPNETTGATFDVSVAAGVTLAATSDIITLSISGVLNVPKQASNTTGSVIIPANSFVSIHIVIPTGTSANFQVNWTLETTKL